MIINKVILTNFLCFLGENPLEFAKGLNIISAPNAGGKSQLFNAFHWALFNTIYADTTSGKKAWKPADSAIVCPDKFKNDDRLSQRITSSVEIELSAEYHLNDEPQNEIVVYTFLKKAVYEKNLTNLLVVSKPELTISFVRNGETEFIPLHQYDWFLNKIFPTSIRKFMWYQGESMDDLYDFSNPNTLKNAINEISYFPMYDNMEKIAKASSLSIEKKIEKELNAQNKLNSSQQKIITDITTISQKITDKEGKIHDLETEIEKLRDDIAGIEHQLKDYDQYRDLKEKIIKLESDLSLTKSRIDDADTFTKETLINKWMLNGCENLIRSSEKNLQIINQEIQAFQKTDNPVPLSLPGPEYVEKMLADHICYICERTVDDNTDAYEALKRRLNDFEKNASNKLLQDNYTELNRARKRLVTELPDIQKEIDENNEQREGLIKKRNSLNKQIKKIYEESGQESMANINVGATTASQMLSKIQSFRSSIETKNKTLIYLQSDLYNLNDELRKKIIERDGMMKNIDTDIVESDAADYIKLFVKSIGKLRSRAYVKLIKEIEEESNRLYSLYLGGKQQGDILISNGIRIVGKDTKDTLSELNTAELVAQKLAVANAFLSLSEKKMKRSYPIVADAPTSDFDPENTYHLTTNIGHSFDQMIIMSKDYGLLGNEKRSKLIEEAKVEKFYQFRNDKIDPNGIDSRTNKKTYISTIK